MIGPAVTVKARPGDNLMVTQALDLAEPGDVVVVDAGGDLTNAIIASSWLPMPTSAASAASSSSALSATAPSSAPAPSRLCLRRYPRGPPYKDGPGEVNVPISIGGMVIHPGDLVCGDRDGVLSVADRRCRDHLPRLPPRSTRPRPDR